jgi:hypothetical protein
MPHRLEHLPDDKVLSLVDAASLLGLEPLTLETLALRRAYGLRSTMIKARRMFRVSDLRTFLLARQQTGTYP